MEKKTRKPRQTKTRREIEKSFNLESGLLTLEGRIYPVLGLPSPVFLRLAMEGAVSLLRGSREPSEKWGRITRGEFGRPRKAPAEIVQSIAKLVGRPAGEVLAIWNALTREEKRLYRNSPQIKEAIAQIQAQNSTAPALDIFAKNPLGDLKV